MSTNRDPWQEAANNIGGGLKFSKGRWTIDNEEIETGENGLRLCLLMETGVHGGLKWHNDRIIDRRLQRFALVAPSNEPLELDWSHYTSVQSIGMSGEYVEQPVTFSSTTWGGRVAFQLLIRPWLQKGRLYLPICTLGSKPKKNDVNGNIDPVFKIIKWVPRSDFDAFLPPDDEPPRTGGAAAAVDDDLPF
jgi:hypothetical protein